MLENLECEKISYKTDENVKKITMKRIAEEAAVSVSCVARCVNKSGYVVEEKRRRICEVMDRLHYIPNQQAKCLRDGCSKLIGHIHVTSEENIFFTKIAATIEKESFTRGYKTISIAFEEGNMEMVENQLRDLLAYRVDGIILNPGINGRIVRELGEKVKGLTIPTVMIERPADVYEVEKVLVDNTEGSYIATERLLAAGHRKIVYLGRESEEPVEQERYHGYVQAMRGVDDAYVQRHSYFTQEYTVEHGFMKCMEILEKMGEDMPTAIFASSDILAAGVLRALYEKKIRVPEDISVIGYDDTIAKFLSPPLSTMRLPVREIAEAAVDALITKLEKPGGNSGNRTVKIGPVYVERNSVRDLNRK